MWFRYEREDGPTGSDRDIRAGSGQHVDLEPLFVSYLFDAICLIIWVRYFQARLSTSIL